MKEYHYYQFIASLFLLWTIHRVDCQYSYMSLHCVKLFEFTSNSRQVILIKF